MKKSLIAAIIILFTIPAIYAQTGPSVVSVMIAKGNTFQLRMASSGGLLVGRFEGKINGKPIEFEDKGKLTAVMNNGSLSNADLRLIETGLDLITSALNRGNYEMPEMNFKLKAEGNALLVTVESRRGGAVFEGKYEWSINGKPLEFKQNTAESIIANNGKLSENEVLAFERWIRRTKSSLGLVSGKPAKQ